MNHPIQSLHLAFPVEDRTASASEQSRQQVLGARDAVSHPEASLPLSLSVFPLRLLSGYLVLDAKYEEAPLKLWGAPHSCPHPLPTRPCRLWPSCLSFSCPPEIGLLNPTSWSVSTLGLPRTQPLPILPGSSWSSPQRSSLGDPTGLLVASLPPCMSSAICSPLSTLGGSSKTSLSSFAL